MRPEVRPQMCPEMRAQELKQLRGRRPPPFEPAGTKAAGVRLLEIYAALARRGEHLLSGLLDGEPATQWRHYPEDDAIDHGSGFQWFYHAHAAEDRVASAEHGHIHLFAHRKLWSRRLRSAREVAFAGLADDPPALVSTRHLLGIGFDAKGVPISLFTVNSWVTGDLMLSAPTTAALLDRMVLDTGHEEVDAVIESVVKLCRAEIRSVLEDRDRLLMAGRTPGILRDKSLEVLSGRCIDIDAMLANI